MTNNKEVGIINEQGFVAGTGLGYTPTNLKNNPDKIKDTDNDKKQSS